MNRTSVKTWGSRLISLSSFLAFIYAGFGYYNQNYFHLVDSLWLSGYSDKIAIVLFGIWRVTQEKNSYTRKRIAILTFLILTIWLLVPYLTGSSFFNHHLIGSAWFYIYLIIILFFGRRVDCGWNCPCVGIRDTAGDAFRAKTPKGSWFWKMRHLKWVFLVSLIVYLLLLLVFPTSPATAKYMYSFWVVNMGIYFASLVVVPWTGNRNYCRWFCPWAALYGIISKLGFYKIVADKDKCILCNKCEAACDMGIPIKSMIQKYGQINTIECMGCGRCVTECPVGALRFVDIRDYLGLKQGAMRFVPTRSSHKRGAGISRDLDMNR